MAEESSVSEVAEREVPVANGGVPHKSSGPATEKKDNESNRVDKMEVDSKDEKRADPEKEDAEAKVDMEEKKEEEPKDVTKQEDNNGDKEEKEEDAPESAAMDLDKDGREDKKEEEPEKAAVEEKSVLEAGEDTNKNNDEIEGSKETQEKVDGLDKELEKAGESREKNEEKNLEEDIEKNDEKMAEERNEKTDEEHKENEEDEEGEEKAEEIKEEKADKGEPGESKEDKGSKKGRSRKNAAGKVREKKKLKQDVEQRTPVTDRPVRERKSVERLVATIEKDANKEIHIEKGRGTPLKDIPNVAYKLARRKPDDTFKLLHSVMFGRRVKAFQIKGNISRFSGFVWHDDEEKQRSKVKEKFDKSTKEKLLEVCDILDIPIAKATTRKEDIIVKLIDFLVAPHATTPVLLAEKESGKGQKRKRGIKRSSSTPRSGSSNRAAKSRTKGGKKASSDSDDNSEDEKEEEEHGTDEEKTVNGVSEESDHGKQDQFESEEESSSEDESGEDSGKKKKQKLSSKKQSAGRAKSNKIEGSEMTSPPPKTTKRSSAKRSKVDNDSEVSPTPRKKNDSGVKKASAKSASKERTVRKTSKGKDKAKDEKAGPSIDELRDAICEILKEVDFNTATFTDILKQLAKKFDTDLTPRKSAIKLVIQEELTKLADEADDEEDADGGAGKDEMAVDGAEVKA